MVLAAALTLVSRLPSRYYWQTAIGVGSLVVTYAFAQGRTTNRERDLHARTILVTGAFTPLGLTVISHLASRGAHIIALSPYPLDHPYATLLIPALRETTKNENIFAEHADLTSPASVRAFCTQFLTQGDQRLDGIVFAHEYAGVGSVFASVSEHERRREEAALATFLVITLLLPALLVAPVERDIRIVNVVNPFYAAGVPTFTSDIIASMNASSTSKRPLLLGEGHRSLRSIVLTRHLQRILNALPNRAPTLDAQLPGGVPAEGKGPAPPSGKAKDAEEKTKKKFPSNIVAVSVAPGMSRSETVRAALGADKTSDPQGYSTLGFVLFVLLYPVIWLLAKHPEMAMQTMLHTLFLPTPFKRALAHLASVAAAEKEQEEGSAAETKQQVERERDAFVEILKPGALYRECSVVTLGVPPLPPAPEGEKKGEKDGAKAKGGVKAKKQGKEKEKGDADDLLDIEDDGEYGGEGVGRLVWEWYENHLKEWEAREKKEKPELYEKAKADESKSSADAGRTESKTT